MSTYSLLLSNNAGSKCIRFVAFYIALYHVYLFLVTIDTIVDNAYALS